ncbi:MAG: hypothetical protein HY057_05575 [Rhodospirillales bacterium]|nr:hypothetical protein [Rhodospirillales bacterium]
MGDCKDLRLSELLAARLCHDLVGPIGAVANGAELLDDGSPTVDPEVVALIGGSARQGSRRLQFFRMAFGSGNTIPTSARLAALQRAASELLDGGRVTLDWRGADPAVEAQMGQVAAKLVLLLVLLAVDTLPRGGTIRLGVGIADGRLTIEAQAAGQAALPAELGRAIREGCDIEELNPKIAPGYLAARLARDAGGALSCAPLSPEGVVWTAAIPFGV